MGGFLSDRQNFNTTNVTDTDGGGETAGRGGWGGRSSRKGEHWSVFAKKKKKVLFDVCVCAQTNRVCQHSE